jgi:hypothetical protein
MKLFIIPILMELEISLNLTMIILFIYLNFGEVYGIRASVTKFFQRPSWTHPSLPWAQRLVLVLLGQQVMANPYNPITLPYMAADVGALVIH